MSFFSLVLSRSGPDFVVVDRLTARIEDARKRRKGLKRMLREASKEKEELEKERKEMVEKELQSCRDWDFAEGRADTPLGFVPDGSVTFDVTSLSDAEFLSVDWALQPSDGVEERTPEGSHGGIVRVPAGL